MDLKTKRIGALLMGVVAISMLVVPAALVTNVAYYVCQTDSGVFNDMCKAGITTAGGLAGAAAGAKIGAKIGAIGGPAGLIVGAMVGAA